MRLAMTILGVFFASWLTLPLGLAQGPVPQAGWPVTYQPMGSGRFMPNVGDLDGDGYPEIIFHDYVDGVYVYRNDGSLLPGWPYQGPGLFSTWRPNRRTLLGDLDGDGVTELAYLDFSGWAVALTPWGTMKPGWPVQLPYTTGGAFAALGDLSGDGHPELVVVSSVHHSLGGNSEFLQIVYALDGTGSELPGFPVTVNWGSFPWLSSLYENPPTVADLDFDGTSEVIFLLHAYDGQNHSLDGPVVVVNSDGTIRDGWPYSPPVQSPVLHEALVANVVGDARPEIVIPGSGTVHVYNSDATYALPVPYNILFPQLTFPDGISFNQNAVGDLDGDGNLELLMGTFNSRILRWDPGAELGEWLITSSGPYQNYRGISIADVDGDGFAEIACWTERMNGAGQHAVHLLDHNMNELPGWPVLMNPYIGAVGAEYTTVFADLDLDGGLELIHVHGNQIHVWDLPHPGPGPVRVEWGHNGHDARGSNFYHEGAVPLPAYLRGDATRSGTLDVMDVITLLQYLFLQAPHACRAQLDFNEDQALNLMDPVAILYYLFLSGPAPATNFPACGPTPPGAIPCQTFGCP